jgi:septal ring factor EnvC (AmiA/AmiB activator)
MESVEVPDRTAKVVVENVGGISETAVELEPGVTVLSGRNATNRTSLLQALMAALGSERASLKADAGEGSVRLELEETHTRTLTRENGGVVLGGSPYLSDATVADLFAFLLESNEARRAVARGDDLRELIMRPVDTAAIRAEIETLESERRDLAARLDERERLREAVDRLEAELDRIDGEIESTEASLAEVRAEVERTDADLAESRESEAELDEKLEELQSARSEREDVRFRLETERETRAELRTELSELEEGLSALPAAPSDELAGLDERIESLRDRKRSLDSTINQLQAVIQFNEEVLADEGSPAFALGESSDDVTDGLLPEGASFTCWTCGSETTRSDVEQRLERVRDRRRELLSERGEIEDDLDAATDEKRRLRRQSERREELERRRTELSDELDRAESEVDQLAERRENVDDEIERLEAAVERLRESEYTELIDLHTEASELEAEIERLRAERRETEDELADRRDQLASLAELEAEREEVEGQLESARTRIRRLEEGAVEAFNEHMDEVLDRLSYANVERIWIERIDETSNGAVGASSFRLHVVRATDGGAVYEDTVEHLSESEREVTGLEFALAGYLVHDVHEEVPFVLLDSLEAIDAGRIAALVDYLGEYAGYLVVALLAEDARPLPDDYHYVAEI